MCRHLITKLGPTKWVLLQKFLGNAFRASGDGASVILKQKLIIRKSFPFSGLNETNPQQFNFDWFKFFWYFACPKQYYFLAKMINMCCSKNQCSVFTAQKPFFKYQNNSIHFDSVYSSRAQYTFIHFGCSRQSQKHVWVMFRVRHTTKSNFRDNFLSYCWTCCLHRRTKFSKIDWCRRCCCSRRVRRAPSEFSVVAV